MWNWQKRGRVALAWAAFLSMQNILEKLDAADRTQAVTIAFERGIIHLGTG